MASLASLVSLVQTGIVGAPLGGVAADVIGRVPAVVLGSATCAAAFAMLPFVDPDCQTTILCVMVFQQRTSFCHSDAVYMYAVTMQRPDQTSL